MVATSEQNAAFEALFRTDGRRQAFKKGAYIIRPGEIPSGIFFIETGIVKAYDITKYGEENLLIIRREHEVFPLIWAITGQERQVIYEALTPVNTLQLSRDKFLAFLTTTPGAMAPLLDMVVEMYRIHSERILNLEYRGVRERVVSFLLMMANRFGEQTDVGIHITVPLRHQDIASSINASRETVGREIASLERQNLVRNGSAASLTLIDTDKLHSLL